MLRAIGRALLLGLIMAVAAPVGAQHTVAFVDVTRIINESERGQAITEQLQDEFKTKLDALRDQQAELTAVTNQLSQAAVSLNAEKQEELRRTIEEAQIRLQRHGEDVEREVATRREELFNVFEAEVLDLIEVVREERGIGIIFAKQPGVFLAVDPQLDLTGVILARLGD